MNYRIVAVCAGLMALGAAGTTSAQAQYYGGPRYYGEPRGYYPAPMYEAGIPPGEVMTIVRASGLRPLTRPALRGSRYVLLASDHMGGQLRVVVSAHNGRILHASPAHDPRFAYQPVRPRGLVPIPDPNSGAPPPNPRSSATRPELKDPPPVIYGARTPAPAARNPSPPPGAGAAPDERIANAPPAADPSPRRPARTPLPRPRPDTAANTATPPALEAAPVAAAPQPVAPAPAAPAPVAPQSQPPSVPTELVPVAPLE